MQKKKYFLFVLANRLQNLSFLPETGKNLAQNGTLESFCLLPIELKSYMPHTLLLCCFFGQSTDLDLHSPKFVPIRIGIPS